MNFDINTNLHIFLKFVCSYVRNYTLQLLSLPKIMITKLILNCDSITTTITKISGFIKCIMEKEIETEY